MTYGCHNKHPKCVNSDGIHTANYPKYPALLIEKQSKRPSRPNAANLPSQDVVPQPSSQSNPLKILLKSLLHLYPHTQ